MFQMSTSKVHVLEQTHPLAVQFHETLNEIKRFLDEFTLSYKSLDHSLASLQPIRQQQEDFKARYFISLQINYLCFSLI